MATIRGWKRGKAQQAGRPSCGSLQGGAMPCWLCKPHFCAEVCSEQPCNARRHHVAPSAAVLAGLTGGEGGGRHIRQHEQHEWELAGDLQHQGRQFAMFRVQQARVLPSSWTILLGRSGGLVCLKVIPARLDARNAGAGPGVCHAMLVG